MYVSELEAKLEAAELRAAGLAEAPPAAAQAQATASRDGAIAVGRSAHVLQTNR